MKSLFVLFVVVLPSMVFSEGNCVKGINLKDVCGVGDWKKTTPPGGTHLLVLFGNIKTTKVLPPLWLEKFKGRQQKIYLG